MRCYKKCYIQCFFTLSLTTHNNNIVLTCVWLITYSQEVSLNSCFLVQANTFDDP